MTSFFNASRRDRRAESERDGGASISKYRRELLQSEVDQLLGALDLELGWQQTGQLGHTRLAIAMAPDQRGDAVQGVHLVRLQVSDQRFLRQLVYRQVLAAGLG